MIMSNSTKNFRVVYNDTSICDSPAYTIYSYNVRIATFYPDTKHLIIYSEYINYSRNTNIHYKLAIGWAIYYFGQTIIKTRNEWFDIKCNTPSIYYIRKLKDFNNEISGIYISVI